MNIRKIDILNSDKNPGYFAEKYSALNKLFFGLKEYFFKIDQIKLFQHPLFFPFLLFALSFYIRYHFLTYYSYDNRFEKYVWLAKQLLEGNDIGKRIIDFSPLYTYFNLLFHYLFLGNSFFIILFQNLLGSINSVLIFHAGKRLFSKPVGVIAGLIMAFYENTIVYEYILEPVTLVLFLNSIIILFLISISDNILRKSELFKILKLCYFSGIFLGLGIITRPNILLLFPFACLWILINNKKAFGTFKHLIAYCLLFIIGILTSVSPVLVINYKAFNKFSPVVMSPGQVFHQGNSIEAKGLDIYYPPLLRSIDIYKSEGADSIHKMYREVAEYSTGKEVSFEESSWFWIEKAVNYIKAYPAEYMKLLLNKSIAFLNPYEMHDKHKAYLIQGYLKDFPLISFEILILLSLMGIVIHFKKGEYNYLLLSIISIYFVSNLIFFITSRQRLPVVPFLSIFSAYFVISIWKYLISKEYKMIFLSIIIFIILLNFISFPFKFITAASKEKTRSIETFTMHNYYTRKHLRENNPALAANEIKTAIARFPLRWQEIGEGDIFYGDEGLLKGAIRIAEKLYPAMKRDKFDAYNMGYLYMLGREYDKAEAIFRKLENQSMLGNIYLSRGMLDKAEKFYEKALELKEFDLGALTQLVVLYEKQGLHNKSIALFENLKKFYDSISISYNLGSAYFKIGMTGKALREWEKVAGSFPEYPIVHINLSKAYAKIGLLDEAYKEFETVVRLVSDLYVDLSDLETLLEKNIKNNPGEFKGYFRLGKLYMKKGDFKKALFVYNRALDLIKNNKININNQSDKEITGINYYVPLIYYGLGDEYLFSRNIDMAVQYFEKAEKFNRSNAELYLKLGHSYQQKGIKDKAMKNYNIFLEMKPEEAEVYKILGNLYYETGDYFTAANLYQKCFTYNPKDADCLFNQGIVYFQMNVLSKALEKYREAIKLNPAEPDYHYNLGLAYKKSGNSEKANYEFMLAKQLKDNH